jgi:DNA topoisomerase-3
LDDPEAYDASLKSWRLDTLPVIPDRFRYHPIERTRDQFEVIRELMAREDVEEVVNAADAGREGELIFDLVYALAGCRKPVRRLWISSLTREAILEGFASLRPAEEYRGLRDSAHARQQADWLVGINATRAQTIKARRAGHDGVFSLGRVQTPTLALIVSRDLEIKEFVPTTYYEVFADFAAEAGPYRGVWVGKKGTRLDKKEEAEEIASRVRGVQGAVTRVERKSVKERAPLLYDLTALQRAANARHNFTANRTLELAQSLYEKKCLTYPRTSSRHLSGAVAAEARQHVEAVNFGPYAKFCAEILSSPKPKPTSRHVDDKKVSDHHAIIPTTARPDAVSLSPDEKRVYDLVARRFLAAFFSDAELERTTINTEAAGEGFVTRGTVVVSAGWREVDPPGREKSAEGDEGEGIELPRVRERDAAAVTRAEAVAKQTKAPPRYTDAALLGAMETAGKKIEDEELRLAMKDSGLGTPATRANIIEILLRREYVARDKKSIVATPKGVALIRMLPSSLLKSAELTGRWEQKLSRMARGEYALDSFLGEVREMVSGLVREIAAAEVDRAGGAGATNTRPQQVRAEGALDCPKCKREERAGFLAEREGASGKFVVCSEGRERCGYISDRPRNAKQRKALVGTSCHACGGAMRLRLPKEKGRRASLACVGERCRAVRWLDQSGVPAEATAAQETGRPCPVCQTPTVKRGPASSGSYFWSCPRWRSDGSGCNAKPVWINER